MRLRDHVPAARTDEVLGRVIQSLEDLRGAGTTITKYASWVRDCEAGLREVLVEPELAEGLHTTRLWQLFTNEPEAGTGANPMAYSERFARSNTALYAEIEHQLHRLQQAQAQLKQILALAQRDGQPLVYDTNSLMHCQPPQDIVWKEIVPSPLRLVVPLVVVDELDRKRYSGTPKMAGRARTGQRALKDLLGSAVAGEPVPVPSRPGVTIEVLVDEPDHRRASHADDEIVDRAKLLQQVVDQPVAIVTNDVGLQVRAKLAGLDWIVLPERYLKPDEIS